jgi:hypothetical protein
MKLATAWVSALMIVASCGTSFANDSVVGVSIGRDTGDYGFPSLAGTTLIDARNDSAIPVTNQTYLAQCFGWAYTPTTSYVLERIDWFAGDVQGTVTVSVHADDGSGHPTGAMLATVTYVETPPRRWQGDNLSPQVLLLAGTTYYIKYQPVAGALTSIGLSGSITPHSWSDECDTYYGPGPFFPWMMRFYGSVTTAVEADSWGRVKALYR